MDYEKFAASVDELAPGHKPEAVPLWLKFVSECIAGGQHVHFEPVADKTAAEGKWLDVLYDGFCAVKEGFGQEAAAAVIELSCEQCCLYPGEMAQAAICLEHGKDAEDILAMIESGDIDCLDLFAPMSRQEAETQMASLIMEQKQSVVAQLKNQPRQKTNKTAPKKSAEKEI